MATQGNISNNYARKLENDGWTIIFKCIPNKPHVNVVPIPTINGISTERYPDIVAIKDNYTLFVEVEISLNNATVTNIIERFIDYTSSLNKQECWKTWTDKIENLTGKSMPITYIPLRTLVICKKYGEKERYLVDRLSANDITCINGDEISNS